MKNLFFLFIILFTLNIIYSQENGTSDEKFDYSTVGHFILYNFDIEKNLPIDTTFKIPVYGARFIRKNEYKYPSKDYNITLIKVLNYPLLKGKDTIQYKHKGSETMINIEDNNKLFWVKSERFTELESDEYIKKRYHLTPQFAYGASLSVPFKLRPQIDETNMRITPEITLGGYLGYKQRLSRYKDIHLYVPVITLGITTLGINDNNVIKDTLVIEKTKDALILGRTFTLGTILEFKSFQIGFIGGWDRAGGEIGKNWVYNDKFWYSFSIGYSFFGKETGK